MSERAASAARPRSRWLPSDWSGYRRATLGVAPLAVVVILIGVLFEAFGEVAQVRVASLFMIHLMVVLGLQSFMGNSKVANLGHVSFMGISAYVVAVLTMPGPIKAVTIPDAPFGLATFSMDVIPAAIVAVVVGTLFALITGLLLTRQSGIAATIATLAWLVIVHVVINNWTDLTRGARALYGIPISANLITLSLIAAAMVVVARLFRDSKAGIQLRASGDDLLAASAMGVNVQRLRLRAWVLSGCLCSIAGVMFSLFLGSISPKSFYFDLTFLTLAMLILGGMQSISGAVLGTIVVTVGFEFMRWLESAPTIFGTELPRLPGLTGFFLGAIIVLFMALRPGGLVGDDEFDELLLRRVRNRGQGTG
ncbi:MAG: branched-chain amino acid ABC transporter permease [Alphaproteobacteria bacterium]